MTTTAHTRPTQAAEILHHLEIHGSITARDAIRFFQCYRLAARIYELKAQGHPITCDKSEGYARYSLTPVLATP